MVNSSAAELRDKFCSYCGRAPHPESNDAHRVCRRCDLGIVLGAPAGQAPLPGDPFLIVDDELMVQAISKRAERVLGVSEADGVLVPLRRFLEPVSANLGGTNFAVLLALALPEGVSDRLVQLRAVNDDEKRFAARITNCGDPPAVLLVLTPLRKQTPADTPAVGAPAHGV
jgi:hypothetical protein